MIALLFHGYEVGALLIVVFIACIIALIGAAYGIARLVKWLWRKPQ